MDFGVKDWYVAEIKLAIKSMCSADIIDLTHQIKKFNINEAKYFLFQAERIMPPGSVTVVVVYPGVGSERKSVLLKKGEKYFIGPDNGVLDYITNNECKCFYIREESFGKVSRTFHGRDIFVPLAVMIFKEKDLSGFVKKVKCNGRGLKKPRFDGESLKGEIIYIDSFGNAITNIRKEDLRSIKNGVISFKGQIIDIAVSYYGDSNLKAVFNSSGFLEISSYKVEKNKGISIGETVEIRRRV